MSTKVFLMGTNGAWRQRYKKFLDERGVSYYDPIIVGRAWTKEDGAMEAALLATCPTIAMVVTTETESIGSLAETGWALARISKTGQRFGLLVENYTDEAQQKLHEASWRARTLVLEHMRRYMSDFPTQLFVADSHEAMLMYLGANGS